MRIGFTSHLEADWDRGAHPAHAGLLPARPALRDCDAVPRLRPGHALACCRRARAYDQINNPRHAVKDYSRALALLPALLSALRSALAEACRQAEAPASAGTRAAGRSRGMRGRPPPHFARPRATRSRWNESTKHTYASAAESAKVTMPAQEKTTPPTTSPITAARLPALPIRPCTVPW
jgi:hypothetical protein